MFLNFEFGALRVGSKQKINHALSEALVCCLMSCLIDLGPTFPDCTLFCYTWPKKYDKQCLGVEHVLDAPHDNVMLRELADPSKTQSPNKEAEITSNGNFHQHTLLLIIYY